MFKDRKEAGQLLTEKLKSFEGGGTVVLGLTRGGVVVAREIARALKIPLDILVVKKIGAPGNKELAVGAVGPDKTVFWDERVCNLLRIDSKLKEKLAADKEGERKGKEELFRQGKKRLPLKEKQVILADDGVATGSTVQAGIAWIKSQEPEKIILAVPVAPLEVVEKLKLQVDGLICLKVESEFWAVGQFYEEFNQVSDKEVINLLGASD